MSHHLHGLLALGLTLSIGAASCAEEAAPLGLGGGSGTGSPSGAGGADATPSGLPCEVAEVLANKCTSCHSDPPRSSAPQPLVTREQLLAPSTLDPAQNNAQRSVDRMRAGTMPVGGGAEVDADVIEAWLVAGAPEGECGAGGGPGEDPFAQPSACESGRFWTSDEEGDDMNPGQACNKCHAEERNEGEEDAPLLVIGGTVYPNGHSPDDCYGIDGSADPFRGVQVVVTDATGRAYTLDVRRTGNFVLDEAEEFVFPYTAKVVDTQTGAERVMVDEPTHGDCNLCHTEAGSGDGSDAPGRILVP